MGRKLKPLPPKAPTKPQRKIGEIESRRSLIWRLLLIGADVRTIRAQVLTKFEVGKGTIEDDVRILRAEATTYYEEERKDMLAVTLAKLDSIEVELRQAAQDAREAGETAVRVSALAAARQTVKDKAQLAGIAPQKLEVSGMVAHAVAAVDEEQMAAFIAALSRSGISPKDAAKMIEA